MRSRGVIEVILLRQHLRSLSHKILPFNALKPHLFGLEPGLLRKKLTYLLISLNVGRCTAPLLVDKKQKKMVSNESADLMSMLNQIKAGAAEGERAVEIDLCPADVQSQIDAMNDWIYNDVNNGVYKCGFSTTQVCRMYAADVTGKG